MAMPIVIVYGPPVGKSQHREALRRTYQCVRIVDAWRPGIPLWAGDLALTNERPPYKGIRSGVTVVPVEEALARIGATA